MISIEALARDEAIPQQGHGIGAEGNIPQCRGSPMKTSPGVGVSLDSRFVYIYIYLYPVLEERGCSMNGQIRLIRSRKLVRRGRKEVDD